MSKLVGSESTLWQRYPDVALVLWVSIPSGDAEIAILRNALADLVGLAPRIFSVSPHLQVLPLWHFCPPLPIGSVYVGFGCESFGLKPSVWLNLFQLLLEGADCLLMYKHFALARPDLKNWLSPLAKASALVCDCWGSVCSCHACVLLELSLIHI